MEPEEDELAEEERLEKDRKRTRWAIKHESKGFFLKRDRQAKRRAVILFEQEAFDAMLYNSESVANHVLFSLPNNDDLQVVPVVLRAIEVIEEEDDEE